MKNDPRFNQLVNLRDTIFDLANSFAGNETGAIAIELHEASNRLTKAINMMEVGIKDEDEIKQLDEWLNRQPFPISPLVRTQVIALALADKKNS